MPEIDSSIRPWKFSQLHGKVVSPHGADLRCAHAYTASFTELYMYFEDCRFDTNNIIMVVRKRPLMYLESCSALLE